ncbi:hypothetical protein PIB30_053085 [Stylosanthes scabra]|uniref:Uncharacterized protein n=1 Tax=Stylosanthes scabra TaxID=79078 RepID=A0ABU6ZH63_9FABA|nr:hypothetical protein [Stylosanthes scabra]
MPIYDDYHGNFRNSNNSSWDQIQAILKILLSSYQSIPSDNLDELSVMSDQKQKRLCADFQQTCARIIATLHEIHDEENSYPEIQAHSDQTEKQICDFQQNSVPKFQEQKSEAEFDERDAATIQNTTKFTDPTQFHHTQEITDLDLQSQIQPELAPAYQKLESSRSFPENKISEQSKSEFQILNISSINQEEEWNSTNSEDQKQYDKLDAMRVYKPPDLTSLAVGEGEPTSSVITAEADSCWTEDLRDAVTGIYSGAEDGTVAKWNVDDDDAAMNDRAMTEDRTKHGGSMEDTRSTMAILVTAVTAILAEVSSTRSLGNGGEQETTSGAEFGAIAETGQRTSATVEDGEAMEKKNGAATVVDGGLRARQLRRVFLLTPPPLLAAVLPWNRVEARTMKKQEEIAFSGACVAGRSGCGVPLTDGGVEDLVDETHGTNGLSRRCQFVVGAAATGEAFYAVVEGRAMVTVGWSTAAVEEFLNGAALRRERRCCADPFSADGPLLCAPSPSHS